MLKSRKKRRRGKQTFKRLQFELDARVRQSQGNTLVDGSGGHAVSHVEFGRFGSNRRCPMFRYSGEKVSMSDFDSDVYLFGHAKLCRRGGRRSATANDR